VPAASFGRRLSTLMSSLLELPMRCCCCELHALCVIRGYVSVNRVVKQLGYSRRTMNDAINLPAAELPLKRLPSDVCDQRRSIVSNGPTNGVQSSATRPNGANKIVRLSLGVPVCVLSKIGYHETRLSDS